MYFLGSGTIHGTYTPAANNPSSWAIWRNYLITNGTVVVNATDVYKFPPFFQRSVIPAGRARSSSRMRPRRRSAAQSPINIPSTMFRRFRS
jgi:hypothetical protein